MTRTIRQSSRGGGGIDDMFATPSSPSGDSSYTVRELRHQEVYFKNQKSLKYFYKLRGGAWLMVNG